MLAKTEQQPKPEPKPYRHIALLYVGEEDVLELFRLLSDSPPESISYLSLKGLPEDAKLLGVAHDFQRRGFTFLLEHPSFEGCPIGAIPVTLPCGLWGERTVKQTKEYAGKVSEELTREVERLRRRLEESERERDDAIPSHRSARAPWSKMKQEEEEGVRRFVTSREEEGAPT